MAMNEPAVSQGRFGGVRIVRHRAALLKRRLPAKAPLNPKAVTVEVVVGNVEMLGSQKDSDRKAYKMRITVVLAIVIAALSTGCATTDGKRVAMTGATASDTGFVTKVITVNGRDRAYCLYVPREYSPEKAWPLIVALHGSGERGEDGLLQTEVGIGHAIRRHADRFPCLVLMPQCAVKSHWKGAWGKSQDEITAEIAQTRNEFRVDPDRTYLTGLSMGGFATWAYGAEHVNEFAALMPLCGGGDPKTAHKLAHIPIWAFHGAADSSVPPQESRRMVEAVKAVGGNVKYTEYEKVNHNCWDRAYDNADTIQWLLSQKRNRHEASLANH